jgi:hypothetical protein
VGGLAGRAYVAPGLLSATECAAMVDHVEAQLQGRWTTSRHYSVPATDVPVWQVRRPLRPAACRFDWDFPVRRLFLSRNIEGAPALGRQVPRLSRWFNAQLAARIYPVLAKQFGVAAASIRVIDAFLVRYSGEKQRSLPLHCDQSQFSLTIAMNSPDQYEGGGTFFFEIGQAVNVGAGGMISFDGSLLHSGHPITQGTRYILAAFLYSHSASALPEANSCNKRLRIK